MVDLLAMSPDCRNDYLVDLVISNSVDEILYYLDDLDFEGKLSLASDLLSILEKFN